MNEKTSKQHDYETFPKLILWTPWYEHNGEPLWEPKTLDLYESKLKKFKEVEPEQVHPEYGIEIRTEDKEQFEHALMGFVKIVDDDILWSTSIPGYKVEQEGPKKTVVKTSFSYPQQVNMTAGNRKKEKIDTMAKVLDYYLAWTKIYEPVLEVFHERYSYKQRDELASYGKVEHPFVRR